MISNIIGQLEYLTAENITTPHCFTTRFGGVSRGHLASMNLGLRRGDDPRTVEENYRILGDVIGFSPEDVVACRQIHSNIVHVVDRSHRGRFFEENASAEGDALITCEPGVALTVFTADCTPVLLHDPVTGAVGAAHAGWRGTAACIAAKTVRAMVDAFGCKPENIRAAIGPNIGPCCFETDRDVPDAMLTAFGERAQAAIVPSGNKYYVNLKTLNALSLQDAGVVSIDISAECTACAPDKYWSHRRVGNLRGSQGAIILCKEGM